MYVTCLPYAYKSCVKRVHCKVINKMLKKNKTYPATLVFLMFTHRKRCTKNTGPNAVAHPPGAHCGQVECKLQAQTHRTGTVNKPWMHNVDIVSTRSSLWSSYLIKSTANNQTVETSMRNNQKLERTKLNLWFNLDAPISWSVIYDTTPGLVIKKYTLKYC